MYVLTLTCTWMHGAHPYTHGYTVFTNSHTWVRSSPPPHTQAWYSPQHTVWVMHGSHLHIQGCVVLTITDIQMHRPSPHASTHRWMVRHSLHSKGTSENPSLLSSLSLHPWALVTMVVAVPNRLWRCCGHILLPVPRSAFPSVCWAVTRMRRNCASAMSWPKFNDYLLHEFHPLSPSASFCVRSGGFEAAGH